MPTIKELPPVPDYYAPKSAEITGNPEDAALTYELPNGSTFVVHADAETLQDVYETTKAVTEAVQVPRKVRTHKLATVAVEAVRQAPEQPQAVYIEPTRREKIAQYFADAKLRRFDKVWNTSLYQEKQAQRRKTAIFLMASEAELLVTDTDSYKRQLNRLAKSQTV
jgi:D-alanyl-D-alanine carboxypeptidase